MDSNLNLVISGAVDVSTALASCPLHTTAGIIPILMFAESDGKLPFQSIMPLLNNI